MAELNIRFLEIISQGQRIRGGYDLVCNGIHLGNQEVRVQTKFSFFDALQCATKKNSDLKSTIRITPLREWTTLKLSVYKQDRLFNLQLCIDLKKNTISLEADSSVINSIAGQIISSFGIQKGNKVFYLMDVRWKNVIYWGFRNL